MSQKAVLNQGGFLVSSRSSGASGVANDPRGIARLGVMYGMLGYEIKSEPGDHRLNG